MQRPPSVSPCDPNGTKNYRWNFVQNPEIQRDRNEKIWKDQNKSLRRLRNDDKKDSTERSMENKMQEKQMSSVQ